MKLFAGLAALLLAAPAYAHHDHAADYAQFCQQTPWACQGADKQYEPMKVGPSSPEEAAQWQAARDLDWIKYGRHNGPVSVRAHTRCNARKCWGVRSYTRRR